MSLISYSKITDGSTVDASDVNTPLDTIYNDHNGGIDSTNLADNAVTTAKITDANVTTAKIADANVTPPKWTNPYKFSVHLAGAQSSIADNAITKVLFDTEKFDTNNNFASNRYTAPVAGFYQINAYLDVLSAANNGFVFYMYLYKNGVNIQKGGGFYPAATGATLYAVGNISHLVQLAANDYLEIYVQMDVGTGTATVIGGATQSSFSGFLVSET